MTSQSVLNMWTIDTSVMGNILRINYQGRIDPNGKRACNPRIDSAISAKSKCGHRTYYF